MDSDASSPCLIRLTVSQQRMDSGCGLMKRCFCKPTRALENQLPASRGLFEDHPTSCVEKPMSTSIPLPS
ncbi:hypothetical protein F2P79_024213 [Pimephales promelas]|nr:hypothetical protein F2P79_024213 [Pimephales promelas]